MSFEDGGYAFPKQDMLRVNGDMLYGYDGMTTRVYLAGKAANGVLANTSNEFYPVDLAKKCLAIADTIIAQDRMDAKEDYEKRKAKNNGN